MALTLVRSLRLLLSRQHGRLASSQSSIEEWQKEKKKRISALENELKQLEKQHNYPRKPIVHPVTLYILEELEMTKGMTGLGSSAVNKDIISPKNLYTECNRKWKSGEVPESIKEKFRRRAENKKQEYEKALKKWNAIYQYSKTLDQIESLRAEIIKVKKERKDTSENAYSFSR